jgi:MFS family permease
MQKRFFYGYVIITAFFILQIVMFGPWASNGVFIKPLNTEFGWSRAIVSGAFSIATVIMGLSGVLMGWLNDRVGPRVVLTLCGFLIGTGMILMFWINVVWQFYLFYAVIVGLGMGGINAPQMSTITRWFVTRRNVMIGLLFVGGSLGGIIGPPLITWLIYTYSWRDAFLFMGIVVFILVILAAQFLKRDPSQMGQIPYQKGNETRRKALANVDDLSLKQALHSAKFWILASMMFCFGFIMMTIYVHLVPLAMDRGISAINAATILSAMSLATTAGSLVVGLITDKIGSRIPLVICLLLILGVTLFLLPVTSGLLLAVFVVVMSLGGGGLGVLEATIVAELFGLKSNGIILGGILFVHILGSALGAFIAGLIFDIIGNYQLHLLICTVLSVAALIMGIMLNKMRKPVNAILMAN